MEEQIVANPWDKQPGEGREAYRAFCVYRNLGAIRTLPKVSDAVKDRNARRKGTLPGQKSVETTGRIKGWSAQYQWVARAGAWDLEQDRQTRARIMAQQVELRARMYSAGNEVAEIALEAIRKLKKQHANTLADSPAKARVEMLEKGFDLVAKGLDMPAPASRVELTGSDGEPIRFANVEEMSEEELDARIAELNAKLAAPGARQPGAQGPGEVAAATGDGTPATAAGPPQEVGTGGSESA